MDNKFFFMYENGKYIEWVLLGIIGFLFDNLVKKKKKCKYCK